jgi:hypothetical protein
MSNKYFSAKEVYAKIVSTYKRKSSEISVLNVMRWCSELVTEVLVDPVGYVANTKIRIGYGNEKVVQDNRVPVPFNMVQLQAVYDQDYRLITDYSYQGETLYFKPQNKPEKVYISYLSIPVDEDGFPLIKRGYETAAYAYCVCKMFEEDATSIPPRIAQWRWMQLLQDKDWEIEAAARSWSDLDESMVMLIHNIIIDPAYAHKAGIEKRELGETANRT